MSADIYSLPILIDPTGRPDVIEVTRTLADHVATLSDGDPLMIIMPRGWHSETLGREIPTVVVGEYRGRVFHVVEATPATGLIALTALGVVPPSTDHRAMLALDAGPLLTDDDETDDHAVPDAEPEARGA